MYNDSVMENHHAYISIGRKPEIIEEFNSYLEKNNFRSIGNPDYFLYEFETLNVDDARKISEYSNKKPFADKIIVGVFANFIGHEAQNVLLKALEEPAERVHFFLMIPELEILLPTVRSRLISINFNSNHSEPSLAVDDKDDFLRAGLEERLKILSGFLSHDSESKKSDLIVFINSLERRLSIKAKNDKNTQMALSELLHLKSFLFDRSPSIKMIAEYLALRLPMTK